MKNILEIKGENYVAVRMENIISIGFSPSCLTDQNKCSEIVIKYICEKSVTCCKIYFNDNISSKIEYDRIVDEWKKYMNNNLEKDYEKHLKRISKEELDDILEKHRIWVESNGEQGERADLREMDLSNANLSNANLREADLSHANLYYTNLTGADLSNADLSNADLTCADLTGANLSDADLTNNILDK